MLGFVFALIIFFVAGLFVSNVAQEKGYNGFVWFIGGFFFSVIALIAVAGLPDKKLRKYIRQIGENQNAIPPEPNELGGISSSQKNQKLLTYEERKDMIKSLGKKKD